MSDTTEPQPDATPDAWTSGPAGKTTPPYLSFSSFITALDRMIEHGPPDQIDRRFFGNISGTVVAQHMGALRFFGLIDENKKPQPRLSELVPPETRQERMRSLIEEFYPEAVKLGTTKSTQAQLDKVFTASGLKGSNTVRKAVSFYLQAAEYTGIAVSPYFTKSRAISAPAGVRRSNGAGRKTSTRKPSPPAGQEHQTPDEQTLNLAEKRSKYIDLLMDLVKGADGSAPDAALLDRIEKALGYELGAQDSPSQKATVREK